MNALGSRIGNLLFKLSVDDALTAHITAASIDIDLDMLKKLRVRCIKDVQETNGEIDFDGIYKYRKELNRCKG